MFNKRKIIAYMTAVLVFAGTAVPSSAAGFAAGFSFGYTGERTESFNGSVTAGLNFKSETIPLCFYGDAAFDLSETGSEVFKYAEISVDYFIASPVVSDSFLHFFYGAEFAVGIYDNYFADAGFCSGLSWLAGYDTELFFKASFRAGITFAESSPSFNIMMPVKCGVKFYF